MSYKQLLKQMIVDFNDKYFTSLDNETFTRSSNNKFEPMVFELDLVNNNSYNIRNEKNKLLGTIKSLNDWNIFKTQYFPIIDDKYKDIKGGSNYSKDDIQFIIASL